MFDNSGNCKLSDFKSFFKTLFCHEDIPNDSEQERVKSDVNNYFESIRDKVFDEIFTCSDLIYEINKLEYGKAPGYYFVVNEMVINAKDSPMFIQILVTFFNSIISYGYFPKIFNTSLLTPIPKKGISKTPSDFRPISVSSVLGNIFELLLLSKINCFREIGKNQLNQIKYMILIRLYKGNIVPHCESFDSLPPICNLVLPIVNQGPWDEFS
ncbi:unnamed protein product [Brachionus calyciflorus]|uniref:Uncharacterized protein n=1 Tax=Brachionus calyciflorus TaxID=104777 RepID=A0A814Q4V8_9BILA|nr:unnamed protein product [Brachionus calyciflorus]